MGVYSLRDKAWKFYGDFCSVGSAAFSPDGKRVAFEAETTTSNQSCLAGDRSHVLVDIVSLMHPWLQSP
jgi:hypothetical protein